MTIRWAHQRVTPTEFCFSAILLNTFEAYTVPPPILYVCVDDAGSELRVAYFAEKLSAAGTASELRLPGVCAWALHRFGEVCDSSGLWLTEAEAEIMVETLG